MPGRKEKSPKKNRAAAKITAKPSQGELSEKDLEKVAGGSGKRQWQPIKF